MVIYYFQIFLLNGYRALKLDDVLLNGKSIKPEKTQLTAIVDSGTSAIIGPRDIISEIVGQVPFIFDCYDTKNLPEVSFILDGITYTVNGDQYMINRNGKSCELGFQKSYLPSQFSGSFILGDSFMKNFYTHFNLGQKKIGFAKIKKNRAASFEIN